MAFLPQLAGALHFLFGLVGLNDIDLLCRVLKLTGLDAVVAGSHGALPTMLTAKFTAATAGENAT